MPRTSVAPRVHTTGAGVTMASAPAPHRGNRIALKLEDRRATSRIYRELVGFTQYCVARIEREVGELSSWNVTVTPKRHGFTSVVIARDGDQVAHGAAVAFDRALAIWDAMSGLEQRVREVRARSRLQA